MRNREEILEAIDSIVNNEEQFSAEMILDIRELLEEEGESK
jgi:hypothetical protein